MAQSQLYFSREGIHTHLVLPSASVLRLLPELGEQLAAKAWAQIGWGDYRYYGAPDQSLLLGLRALLLPTHAVIAVKGLDDIVTQASAARRIYNLGDSPAVIDAVAAFIARYFLVNRQQQLIKVRNKPCGEAFYRSRGIYIATNTCNNWTSRGLKQAGLRCLPSVNFLPGQVEQSVRRNGYLPEPLQTS